MNLIPGPPGRAGSQVSEGRVTETLDEILARPEFREDKNLMAELIDAMIGWLSELLEGMGVQIDPGAIEVWGRVIWIMVAVSAGAGLLWFSLSVAKSRAKRMAEVTTALPDEVAARVAALRIDAREAQEQGDLTRALRLYFFALVVGLGERGELAYSDAFTNRELLERGEPNAPIAKLLRPLVSELDEHSFGQRPTGLSEVRRFAGLCEDLLGGGTL